WSLRSDLCERILVFCGLVGATKLKGLHKAAPSNMRLHGLRRVKVLSPVLSWFSCPFSPNSYHLEAGFGGRPSRMTLRLLLLSDSWIWLAGSTTAIATQQLEVAQKSWGRWSIRKVTLFLSPGFNLGMVPSVVRVPAPFSTIIRTANCGAAMRPAFLTKIAAWTSASSK